MKDIPHHMNKMNRKVIRSTHREEMEEENYDLSHSPSESPFAHKQTVQELKKQAKRHAAAIRKGRAPTPPTPEEQNKKMKHRNPVFDRKNNSKPKTGARPTSKKTPRI